MSEEQQNDKKQVNQQASLLLVSNDQGMLHVLPPLLERLEKFHYPVVTAKSTEEALQKLAEGNFPIIMLDHTFSEMAEMAFLNKTKEMHPDALRVMLTPQPDMELPEKIVDRILDRGRVMDSAFQLLRKEKRRKVGKPSDLNQLFEAPEGLRLLNALLDLEASRINIRTVVKDKNKLPSMEDLEENVQLLAESGFVQKQETLPIIFKCPDCGSVNYTLTPMCPFCSSRKLKKGVVLKHLSCSTTDFKSAFEKDEQLVCPHCGEKLRQRGGDYRKMGTLVHCEGCGEFFDKPIPKLECNSCGSTYSVNEAEWERKEVILPNKQKIKKYMHTAAILSEIEKIMKKRGLYVTRNFVLTDKQEESKFNLVVYRNESDYVESKEPLVIADIGYHPSGRLQEEIRQFFFKLRRSTHPPTSFYFIASPSLSQSAKKLCEAYDINILEIELPEDAQKAMKEVFNSINL
ncbi:MAG: hypothetical protein GWO20_19205 [Candidatus Korarchaeota archaeon]|nr:hypothetical protein [Candidatus Korarchaeota archaeon]NIU85385.1 hypothetical protein [Candidatus Thorarchaeota archaeon]NIW15483.1 hypothetical protein [Candidatus Thorarchaeota archaeon]NIW53427.1 hypothetical protein [Candidatus Korarchaeota archaeon]